MTFGSRPYEPSHQDLSSEELLKIAALYEQKEEQQLNKLAPTGLPYQSPSRMEKIDHEHGCKRAYAYRYINLVRGPKKPASAFGTAVHAVLEAYFKQRKWPVSDMVGQVAMSGLKFLPSPHESLSIEHEFEYECWPGIWFQGKIDVYDRTRYRHPTEVIEMVERGGVFEIGDHKDDDAERKWFGVDYPKMPWRAFDSLDRPIPLVIDHKTTGDFKWLKTDAVLRGTDIVRGDPQPAFYGWNACLDFFKTYGTLPEWVHFRWIYYLRAKDVHRSKAIDVRMTPAQIWANCERWKPEATTALELHKIGKPAEETEPNANACKKFGGCEYGPPTKSSPNNLNVCKLDSTLRFRAAMTANIPLSQQVAAALPAFAQNGQQQAAPTGGAFGGGAPAQAQTQAAPAGGAFGGGAATQPAAGGAFGNGQPAASAFGGNAAPAAGGAFGGAAPAQTQQAPAGGAFGGAPAQTQQAPAASAFGAFAAQPQVQQPAVHNYATDPRLAEIPAEVDAAKRIDWLKHCDDMKLDHRNGQPRTNAPVVSNAAPVNNDDAFKAQAMQMWNEGRLPQAGVTHPRVAEFFTACVQMNGPSPAMQANAQQVAAQQAQQPAPAAPRQRRSRKQAGDPAQNSMGIQGQPIVNMQQGALFAHPDVQNFLIELRDFFDSFVLPDSEKS